LRKEAFDHWLPDSERPIVDSWEFKSISFFQREKKNIFRSMGLLLLTVGTTTVAGYYWDAQFQYAATGILIHPMEILHSPTALLRGIPYALSILFILLSHEMGHFLACRYHRIHSTPPFPIPFPAGPGLISFGTLGALIKIKEPFQNRRQLFDVGVAGPIAGMVAAMPIFVLGLVLSQPSRIEASRWPLVFGDNLMTLLGTAIFFPTDPSGYSMALHPLGWAAFFGFLATSLNLLPIGQLDGGHISYAVFGPRGHKIVSYIFYAGLIGISFLSFPSYLLFALILIFLRLRHPPTLHDQEKIGVFRKVLAVVAVVIFFLTFIPIPIQLVFFE